jgi:hypothetical protein
MLLYRRQHEIGRRSTSRNLILGVRRTFPAELALPYARRALLCLSSNIILHVPRTFRLQSILISVACAITQVRDGYRRVCSCPDSVAACSFAFCTCCPRIVASKAIFVEPHRRRPSTSFTHLNHSSLAARSKGSIPSSALTTSSCPRHCSNFSRSTEKETLYEPRCRSEPLALTRLLFRCERHRIYRSHTLESRLALFFSPSRGHKHPRHRFSPQNLRRYCHPPCLPQSCCCEQTTHARS